MTGYNLLGKARCISASVCVPDIRNISDTKDISGKLIYSFALQV